MPDAPLIPQSPLTESTKTIVLEWINECNTQHLACTNGNISSYPRRILDLQTQESSDNIRLVMFLGADVRYTALTYC